MIGPVTVGGGEASDAKLVAEQIDFYRADAESFDSWLGGLLDKANDEPTARTYRAGRARIARVFARYAPLGRVLELAAGTGRLVELYAPHAESVVLLDASPESLAIAARRLGTTPRISFVEVDIFYEFYAPVDGISTRDHFGRRWRVVHNLWDPEDLSDRLDGLGWTMNLLGTGLFGNIVWAEAHR